MMKNWLKSADLDKMGVSHDALQGLVEVGVLQAEMFNEGVGGRLLSAKAFGQMFDLLALSYVEMARVVDSSIKAQQQIKEALESAPSLSEALAEAEVVNG